MSLLAAMTANQQKADKRLFKPLRDMMAGEVNDTSLIDAAKEQVNDPNAVAREQERNAREAGRYGFDGGSAFDQADQTRLAGLRRAMTDASTLNRAQMDQYTLNTNRRNELLNTMRGLQGAAVNGANSLLQAENRRSAANDQAEAADEANKNAAIGTGVGLVIAIA